MFRDRGQMEALPLEGVGVQRPAQVFAEVWSSFTIHPSYIGRI